jgi:UDP-3-O-[3-hydroxymyristoyl] glucosamine N-acyltransferase
VTTRSITVQEIAELVGGTVASGDGSTLIRGAASVNEAAAGEVTFFGNARYLSALKRSKASAALVALDFADEINAIQIKVENPSLSFSKVIEHFAPAPVVYSPGVHATAVLGPDVVLGKAVSIQPYAVVEAGVHIGAGSVIGAHVFIGQNSRIGESCRLHPNVTVCENAVLGDRVTIHSGTVVGSDGFGYEFSGGRHVKIPQVGTVQIDNDVEIGANVTIDRARFGRTWIQEGAKIDNLVQIAHNVVVGQHAILVSQVGISGSSRIGNYAILAGQVGVVGHVEVGDQVVIGAKSGVSKSVPAGEKWFGIPAVPDREFKTRLAYTNRLEKLVARVKALEQLLDLRSKSSPPES